MGARRPAQVDGWISAATQELTQADLQEIADAIARTGAGAGAGAAAAPELKSGALRERPFKTIAVSRAQFMVRIAHDMVGQSWTL